MGEDALRFHPLTFEELPGWANDRLGEALDAFRRSCRVRQSRPAEAPLDPRTGAESAYGRVGDWADVCRLAETVPEGDPAANEFFEAHFTPVSVEGPDGPAGLFTGYYEPEIKGARDRSGPYQTPLLARPPDLVTADLGLFDPELEGERIRGRVAGGRFIPYPARADIERDAQAMAGLGGRVLAWVADPVDAFFMHIQGSGRILLEDGSVIRLGFAEKNGRPYTAIGRVLIDQGALERDAVSMQTIRAWLAENPDRAEDVLRRNESYIFFKEIPVDDPALGPPGAGGAPLTAGRSLAVDRRFHALGAPVWLDAEAPLGPGGTAQPYRRLMIAQDTGSAIIGQVRGDVFWGSGAEAGERAGRMKHQGRLAVLLPKALAARLEATPD